MENKILKKTEKIREKEVLLCIGVILLSYVFFSNWDLIEILVCNLLN